MSNNSNFKQIKAQEKNGTYFYKTKSGMTIKTDKKCGSVFEDANGNVYAEGLKDADIQGTDKNDNLTLFDCNVDNINLGKGEETLNVMGTTVFDSQVVFEKSKGDIFNVQNEKTAFNKVNDWYKKLFNSSEVVNKNMTDKKINDINAKKSLMTNPANVTVASGSNAKSTEEARKEQINQKKRSKANQQQKPKQIKMATQLHTQKIKTDK